MKSKEDFKNDHEYKEYLKYYYAAFAMQAVCVHYMILDKKDMDKNITIAVELAEKLINKLENNE